MGGDYTSSYATVKPLEGSVVDLIDGQEKTDLANKQHQLQVAKAVADKKDKEETQKRELWEKYAKPITPNDTGSSSLNEVQAKAILAATEEFVPLMETYNNKNLPQEQRVKALMKLQNLQKLPENMLAMTKDLTARDMDVRTQIAEGKLWEEPEYLNNFQAGYKNKHVVIDENGNPALLFRDTNGDEKLDLETYDQIKGIVPKYDFMKRFDRDKELQDDVAKIKPQVNGTDDGTTRTVTTGVDKDVLAGFVKNKLFNQDGTPNEVLKSFAREANVDFNDPKAVKQIADGYANDMMLYAKGGTVKTRNYDNLDVQKEANRRAEKKKDDEKDADKPIVTSVTNTGFQEDLQKDKSGKTKPLTISKKGVLRNGVTFKKGISIDNIGGEKSELNNINIKSFYLNDKNEIIYTATVSDDKTTTKEGIDAGNGTTTVSTGKKKRITRIATAETEAAMVAKMQKEDPEANINSPADLKLYLRKLNGKDKETAAERAARIANGN